MVGAVFLKLLAGVLNECISMNVLIIFMEINWDRTYENLLSFFKKACAEMISFDGTF